MTPERIEEGVVVSLAYTLTVDGHQAELVTVDAPIEYLHGADNIVPGLEAALHGKRPGDKIDVTLPPEQGYGEYDEDEVETIDRSAIPGAEALRPGMAVELEDEDGFLYDAVVREVSDRAVVLDFNPPLAGKILNYHVEVIGLREATPEELDHGHPHGVGGEDDGFFQFYEDGDYDDEDDEEA